jgi:hypothetical protein
MYIDADEEQYYDLVDESGIRDKLDTLYEDARMLLVELRDKDALATLERLQEDNEKEVKNVYKSLANYY